ncbi:MAG: hypothetical protein M1834_006554 [Cirrosporium novae-zelandiae]|nr:MAG: hypothetical protein M1834_006554 [Cirrosporium novae-zelandiae]
MIVSPSTTISIRDSLLSAVSNIFGIFTFSFAIVLGVLLYMRDVGDGTKDIVNIYATLLSDLQELESFRDKYYVTNSRGESDLLEKAGSHAQQAGKHIELLLRELTRMGFNDDCKNEAPWWNTAMFFRLKREAFQKEMTTQERMMERFRGCVQALNNREQDANRELLERNNKLLLEIVARLRRLEENQQQPEGPPEYASPTSTSARVLYLSTAPTRPSLFSELARFSKAGSESQTRSIDLESNSSDNVIEPFGQDRRSLEFGQEWDDPEYLDQSLYQD